MQLWSKNKQSIIYFLKAEIEFSISAKHVSQIKDGIASIKNKYVNVLFTQLLTT